MKSRRPAAGRIRLGKIGEDELLEKLLRGLPLRKDVVAGAGDDAAIVVGPDRGDLAVLKTDCVVENVHFDHTAAAETIGWKAMMRPLSDFAAVSAVPRFALATLIAGKEKEVEWVTRIYRGLKRAAGRFGVSIVGGETSGTRGPTVISVSVIGQVEKKRWVSRSGGRSGDHLFVTGRLGGSIRGKHLRFVPRIQESRWLTANFQIHAMMDLSDGLGADLPRLARASKVGFQIERKALPRAAGASAHNAISDGEDYELLFSISARDSKRLQTRWARKFPKVRLTRIGWLIPQSKRNARPARTNSQLLPRGYVHFQ
ncbi:MAG TPA: thiamine-phosphate kinase [Chthoniobacterales bacterium]|jgi:thiamine-monophosphate kinase